MEFSTLMVPDSTWMGFAMDVTSGGWGVGNSYGGGA